MKFQKHEKFNYICRMHTSLYLLDNSCKPTHSFHLRKIKKFELVSDEVLDTAKQPL